VIKYEQVLICNTTIAMYGNKVLFHWGKSLKASKLSVIVQHSIRI